MNLNEERFYTFASGWHEKVVENSNYTALMRLQVFLFRQLVIILVSPGVGGGVDEALAATLQEVPLASATAAWERW